MAMRGVNKAILIGHLGDAPEIIEFDNGDVLAKFSVATSEVWTDKASGEPREKTEWHRVSVSGKLAEVAEQYLIKGSQVYIEGQLTTRQWEDDHGQKHYATEIVVRGYNGVMQMLGSPNAERSSRSATAQSAVQNSRRSSREPSPPQRARTQKPSRQPSASPMTASPYHEPPMDFDDDIPFAPIAKPYRRLCHCC